MKTLPNIVIVEPSSSPEAPGTDSAGLAAALASDAATYLMNHQFDEVMDTESGYRGLPMSLETVSRFGKLDLVIVLDDDDLAGKIVSLREDAPVVVWNSSSTSETKSSEQMRFPLVGDLPSALKFLHSIDPAAWRSAQRH